MKTLGRAQARAYSNIALIKYWGKEDEELIIPKSSSLSMTLDCFYTDTEVDFREDIEEDLFYLNNRLESPRERDKVSKFVDIFRERLDLETRVIVRSNNHLPTAAGLASSASGYAALATALNEATGLGLDRKELSRMARRGSGSASRSIFGGFVQWEKGYSHESSYAYEIDRGNWDIGMIVVVVDNKRKKISSRQAMKHTVESSAFYKAWLEETERDLEEIKKYIGAKDIVGLGQVAERNSLMMHATMLAAKPAIIYWNEASLRVMNIVRDLRSTGIPAYFTMDAGPNVKIICRQTDFDLIEETLSKDFKRESIIRSGIGPGAKLI